MRPASEQSSSREHSLGDTEEDSIVSGAARLPEQEAPSKCEGLPPFWAHCLNHRRRQGGFKNPAAHQQADILTAQGRGVPGRIHSGQGRRARDQACQPQEMFIPIVHRTGEAQVDFGFAVAKVAGVLRKIAWFVMELPHSDAFCQCLSPPFLQ